MYSASASRNPRVFATGASGYLGGSTISHMVTRHPDWDVVVLVRTEEQEERINAAWPNAQVVLGDLDDADTLIDEASKADVALSRLRSCSTHTECAETLTMQNPRLRRCHAHSQCEELAERSEQARASTWISHPYIRYRTLRPHSKWPW